MKYFSYEPTVEGVELTLSEEYRRFLSKSSKKLSVRDWRNDGDENIARGLVTLASIFQELTEEQIEKESLAISHEFVAGLGDVQAASIGLPPSIPYQLRVFSTGTLVDGTYAINAEFLDRSNYVFIDDRRGSIARVGRINYRVPSPIFDILEEVRAFDVGLNRDLVLETTARIVDLFGRDRDSLCAIEPEKALANISIRHASGFSAAVTGQIHTDPEIKPVFFARHLVDRAGESGDLLDESQQILEAAQADELSQLFLESKSSPSTFLLSSGEYIYLDPSMRSALTSFREICNSSAQTKKEFIKSPRAMILRHSEFDDEVEQAIEHLFIETSQFSDRVISVQEWKAPELPFYSKESNDWGIDVVIFSQEGNDSPVVIPKSALSDAANAIRDAIAAGDPFAVLGGLRIPANEKLKEEIERTLPERPDTPVGPTPGPDPDPVKPATFVVHTQDNFEELNYRAAAERRNEPVEYRLPRALKPSTQLLDHQISGVKWLTAAYASGLPGVLNADDMGLGKTLQALVFMSLYRERPTPARPMLIVAPTGLLANWQREIDEHLQSGGLGTLLLAYGAGLKAIRTGGGKDTDSGTPLLDYQRVSEADVVLTTYETQRDYQASFSMVRFSIVVFDEIQKVKNPKSLISRSATTLNADFKIGLSGTPVENSIADLWTIMDVIAPGQINLSLKEFLKTYAGDPSDSEVLAELDQLKAELLEGSSERTPPVLRRMKDDVFKGVAPDGSIIPKKRIVPISELQGLMPKEQEDFYSNVVNQVSSGGMKAIEALHYFRKISLSPRRAEEWHRGSDDYIKSSARLEVAFKLLDEIHEKREKVIIFVESREIQSPLSEALYQRYSLARRPLIINGAISGSARQERVNEFQKGLSGFDAIIISPKAGGVGLTLTAANHVLHLERWWNPAIEDQCNDRAYRIGQQKDVSIYTPLSVHPALVDRSFDLVLDRILSEKRQLARSLFVPAELRTEDFDELFEAQAGRPTFHPRSLAESYELETGEDFERYVADSLYAKGYEIRLTPHSWDKGCDLVATKLGKKILIQCKQVRSPKVLQAGAREIYRARESYGQTDLLVLISNATQLSQSELGFAKENDIKLLLGDQVERYGQALDALLFG